MEQFSITGEQLQILATIANQSKALAGEVTKLHPYAACVIRIDGGNLRINIWEGRETFICEDITDYMESTADAIQALFDRAFAAIRADHTQGLIDALEREITEMRKKLEQLKAGKDNETA